MVQLRTLGETLVRRPGDSGDEALYLQPKRLAVLAYLAAARPRGLHRRDSLLVVFWPEHNEERARNALSQTLHAIRHELGADVLVAEGHELVGVNPTRLTCDAVEFEERLAQEDLEGALRLYRGDFLVGLHVGDALGFDRWQEAEAWRLRRRAWEAATRLAEGAESDGNPVAAIHWLEHALELLPTDEALLRRLVMLTDSLGDRAGALRAYGRFAEAMREEYAVDPSPETEALVSEIRARTTPAARPSPPAAAGTPIRSLAVLPLENLTGRPGDEYFADGMTEMLITELSGIGALRVLSRQSVRAFKGSDRPLRELSDLLGVDAILEGSVLRAGDRIRVVVQLVRVDPEAHVWADAYDRDLGDVLSLYSEIAAAVASEVEAKLSGDERRSLRQGQGRSVHPAAYDRLLRGIALFGQSAYPDAMEELRAAVTLDPSFAEAHAWMAATLGRMAHVVGPQLAEPMRGEVELALELGPDLQWAHAVRGIWLQIFAYDWPAADAAFRRAADAKRRDARALQEHALFLVGQCRFEEASEAVREWMHFDPGVGGPHFAIGYLQHKTRRFEESTEQLEFVIARWPEYAYTPIWLASNYALLGRFDEGTALMRRAVAAAPDYTILLGYAGAVFGLAGATREARGILRRFQASRANGEYVDPFNAALVCMGLGDNDAALDELERCASEGSVQNWILAPEPFFDPLREEPRFAAVLKRLNLPEPTAIGV
jgi:TolB-like protein